MAPSFPNANRIMSQKHHKLLFSDLKTIYALNESFLHGLEAIIDGGKWDVTNARLSAPFEQFIPFFSMYQNYLNNYEAASQCYHEYSTKPDFIAFENHARNVCDGQNLQSLIILPIQRLPRYKLLLSEIVKNTEANHIDFHNLEACLHEIGKTAKLLNERMKEYELRAKVRKIEQRFISSVSMNLVKPHRSFVKEGKLFKIDRKGTSVECVFLLFSDILIYAAEININKINATSVMDVIAFATDAKSSDSNYSSGNNSSGASGTPTNTKLRLKQELPIDSVFSVKNIDEDHKKFGFRGFEIHSCVKSFYVYANTVSEKEEWLKTLKEVVCVYSFFFFVLCYG